MRKVFLALCLLLLPSVAFALGMSMLSGDEYLFRDEFTIERTFGTLHGTVVDGVPAGTTRTVNDIDGNDAEIYQGHLWMTNGTGYGEPGYWADYGVVRAAGRTIIAKVRTGGTAIGGGLIGFDTDKTSVPYHAFFLGATLQVWNAGTPTVVGAMALDTEYDLAIVLKAAGATYWIRGGSWATWTMVHDDSTAGNTATPLYPAIIGNSLNAGVSFLRVPKLLITDAANQLNRFCPAIVVERPHYIYVNPTGDNVLRTAIANRHSLWASKNNPTVMMLAAGTYNEIQIPLTNYLRIQGAGIGSTVIVSDGLRSDIDPVSGLAYSAMSIETKHGIWIGKDLKVSDLTWRVNDVKYALHLDGAGDTSVEDCRIEHSNGFPLGYGVNGGYTASIKRTTLVKLGNNVASGNGSHGVFMHNSATQAAPATFTMEDVTAINCGLLTLLEQASGQTDPVTLTRCSTNDNGTAKGVYLNASGAAMPYNLEISASSCTMPDFAFNETTRPNALDHYTEVP